MEHKVWIRCHVCTEAFSAYLSEQPEVNTSVMSHTPEMEMQYGETAEDGQVYAKCPNLECDGQVTHFEVWMKGREMNWYFVTAMFHDPVAKLS